MTEWLSLGTWTAAFLFFELPSKDVWGLWPWYSLSETVQVGIAWWWPLAVYTALFMVVLLGHFELNWSAGWIIALGFLGACLIASHLIKLL